MKKRKIALMLVLSTVMMMFSGCGQADAGSTSETEANEGVVQEEIPSGNVSLRVWGDGEDAELLAQMVESFQAEYAGQATFDITIEAQTESECKNVILGDIENAADVFTFVDDQLMALVAAGVLLPVDNADAVRSANVEGAVVASTVNDTLYAYPMTADNGYFMYYNSNYFSETDAQTLDGLLNVAAANGKKVAMDWSSGWYLYSFFGKTGMNVGLNEDGITNYCDWNNTTGSVKGVDVADAMLSIAMHPGFANMTSEQIVAGIKDGTVIATVSGVWDANLVEATWGSGYAATKLPTYTCAGTQIQMSSFAGYKMVGANAYSDQPYWSLKLADWITNEQNQALRFQMRAQGPANINAANSSEVQASPAIQAILKQGEFASLQRIGGQYWDPVSDFGQKMAAGNPDGSALQDLMDKMVEQITELN